MNQKDLLTPYIKSQLQSGVPVDTVKQQLIQKGWNADLIDEAASEIATSLKPEPAATPNLPPVASMQPVQAPTQAAPLTPVQESRAGDYSLTEACKEAFGAFKSNNRAVVVLSLLTILGWLAAFVLIAVVGVTTLQTSSPLAQARSDEPIFFQVIMRLLPLTLFTLLVFGVVSAFTQALMGLAIYDGAEGRKSAIKQTMSIAAKRFIRFLLATILYSLIVSAPMLLLLALGLAISILLPSLMLVIYVLGIVAMAATALVAIRIAIMPLVALFEPAVPLSKLYSRTRYLMNDGGTLFVVRYMIVTFVLSIILAVLFPNEYIQENGLDLRSTIGILIQVISFLVYSALFVMFYRNRKAARG
jgi:hypothetical protein